MRQSKVELIVARSRGWQRSWRLTLLSIVAVSSIFRLPVAVAADIPFALDRLIGNYEMSSPRCTEEVGGISNKCSGLIKDRLVIERFAQDNVRVIIHSHQESNHQCHMAGVGQIIDKTFRYCLDYEPGTCLTISEEANKLVVHVTVEGTRYIPFCGSRATLDGLEFPLASKIDPTHCRRGR